VVARLRSEGHEVYDFRNPREGDHGFHWSEIGPDWQKWTPAAYSEALFHPIAERGFRSDLDAMKWAEAFVGVQPFGRSASMEMGWAAGQGKPTILLLADGEPELMVKMFSRVLCTLDEVVAALHSFVHGPRTSRP
jgi:hypothetical protein